MIRDAQGHALSGATDDAAATYDEAVRAFTLVCGDAPGAFDAAREAAPEFVMPHLGRAWLLTMANDPGLLAQAAAVLETARPLAKNEREEAHVGPLLGSAVRIGLRRVGGL